jgi:hypothetical protein
MTVNINNKEIILKYTLRSMIIYEKIMGEPFTSKGLTEVLVYLYSTILASYKDLELSFEQFIEWLDDNPDVLTEFNKWLANIFSRNAFISEPEKSEEEDPTKKN